MNPNIFQLVITITEKRGGSIPLDNLPDKTMTPPHSIHYLLLMVLASSLRYLPFVFAVRERGNGGEPNVGD